MVRPVASVILPTCLSVLLCVVLVGCGKPVENAGGVSVGNALDIVGVWRVKPDKSGDAEGFTYEFTATEMAIKDNGRFVMSGTYKIDESKRPRMITYRMTKGAPDTTVERQILLFMNELSIGKGDNLVILKRVSK